MAHLLTDPHEQLAGRYRAQARELVREVVATGGAIGWVDPPANSTLDELFDDIASNVREGNASMAAVVDGNDLAGFGYWQRYERETHRWNADIRKVVVHPARRRRGIARTVMSELIRTAISCELEVLTLDFRGDNMAAKAMYDDLGFVRYGTLPRFIAVRNERYDKEFYYLRLR